MQRESAQNLPDIIIQVVHLDGPCQGQIDEFKHNRISIGRDTSCDVKIGADNRSVSRRHAEILRDQNRFIFINHGQNGSIVNGQRVDQAVLKQGDIITLTENGPRISFLTQHQLPPSPIKVLPETARFIENDPALSRGQMPETTAYTIQYGTYVRTVHTAVCRLGRDNKADLIIDHPSVHPIHAELIYKGGEFFIRDITGTPATTVNHRDARIEILLRVGDIIELGRRGPQFRFLGDGRFVEFNIVPQEINRSIDLKPVFECHRAFSNTHADFEQPRGIFAWFKRTRKDN